MQDFDTSSTQSLIDRYYQEEKALREREQKPRRLERAFGCQRFGHAQCHCQTLP